MIVNEREKKILLSEFVSKKITLKNRFVMSPVPTGFVEKRTPTNENIKFYGDRARSVGLIIAGAINIDHETAANHERTPIITKENLLVWQMITEAVHQNNGKIVAQIWHSGGYRSFCLNVARVTTPSGIVSGKRRGDAMTIYEIATIISKFAETAFYAKEAGFDGIEIHGAHGGLIHDFFCSDTNFRTDEYGITNRTLFAEKIIRECRKAVGEFYPLLLRISNFKMYNFNAQLVQSPAEFEKFLLPISDAGVDMFDCSAIHYTDVAFASYDGSLAYWAKKITAKPTINVGCVGACSPFSNDANDIIQELTNHGKLPDKITGYGDSKLLHSEGLCRSMENSDFDLIAVGRPLLWNPDWVNNL